MNKALFRGAPFRIAMIYAALFSLSALCLLIFVYFSAAQEFEEQLRERIVSESKILRQASRAPEPAQFVQRIEQRMQGAGANNFYYALIGSSGRRLAGNLPKGAFRTGWQEITVKEEEDDKDDEPEDDLTTLSLLGVKVQDNGLLVVGASREKTEDLLEIILQTAALGLVLIGILAVGGGLLMSRASLARLSNISRATRKIMLGDLARRLPTKGAGDELDQLSSNINEMLDHIELLVETTKQVSNDIAHDLRTPLGRLRQNLEGARRGTQSVAAYRKAFDRAVSETEGILETFDALLRVGRISASTAKTRFSEIDLSQLLSRIAETYEPVAADKNHRLRAHIDPGLQCWGDKEMLVQMLVNLIENAINHCPNGSEIDLELTLEKGRARIIVSDTGPGIPPDEREKVFRSFYRLEQSRTTPGNGIGLALVKAIAEKHHIAIELKDRKPGLIVSLQFPAVP